MISDEESNSWANDLSESEDDDDEYYGQAYDSEEDNDKKPVQKRSAANSRIDRTSSGDDKCSKKDA